MLESTMAWALGASGMERDPAALSAWMAKLAFGFMALVTVPTLAPSLEGYTYGRYTKPGAFGVNVKLAWVVQEAPAFLMATAVTALNWDALNWAQVITIGAFITHYFQRTFVFPFLLKSGGKTTPFAPFAMAFFFCAFNGFFQGFTVVHASTYGDQEHTSARFIAGLLMFVVGFLINVDSDRRLRGLRGPKDSGYKIPRGGVFELVSAANYFGEILEWIGYGNISGLFFASWSLFFLGTRGVKHHKWYLAKFPDTYPKGRRAVLPFIL